ncbi:hypothetical protein PoB_002907800 [Plakobranchus ocellatus]|uniref:Uncharacterized protein n=1 Tax=Plakobranchus ocellatus TaxID=259542 RepID=A0AAV4A5V5_9GAST|nr:hypothetical protein PoB_002907800 [Plakobranchus ocellatus]
MRKWQGVQPHTVTVTKHSETPHEINGQRIQVRKSKTIDNAWRLRGSSCEIHSAQAKGPGHSCRIDSSEELEKAGCEGIRGNISLQLSEQTLYQWPRTKALKAHAEPAKNSPRWIWGQGCME